MTSIDGQTIVSLRTRKTMHDQNNIIATTDTGHEFMINVDDLLPIMSELLWEKKKARKHTYLINCTNKYQTTDELVKS